MQFVRGWTFLHLILLCSNTIITYSGNHKEYKCQATNDNQIWKINEAQTIEHKRAYLNKDNQMEALVVVQIDNVG